MTCVLTCAETLDGQDRSGSGVPQADTHGWLHGPIRFWHFVLERQLRSAETNRILRKFDDSGQSQDWLAVADVAQPTSSCFGKARRCGLAMPSLQPVMLLLLNELLS